MIEVSHLSKHFGKIKAVDDISFKVERGEILGFLGPNGAGKTTTMRILTGYFPQTEGIVKVAGFDVFEQPLEVKRRIGYLPEVPLLYGEMPVCSYLNFVAEIKGVPRKERKKRIEDTMEKTGITEVQHRLTAHLSRGYKQRVALAASLVNDPQVLILDEPTIGLDPKQIAEIRSLIKSLSGERTIILSSHILPEVEQICQRVVIINEGKIVAEDKPTNLSRHLQKAGVLFLKLKGPVRKLIDVLGNIEGVRKIEVKTRGREEAGMEVEYEIKKDIREDLFHKVVENKGVILELRPIEMTLEDIFLQLTTKEEEVKV